MKHPVFFIRLFVLFMGATVVQWMTGGLFCFGGEALTPDRFIAPETCGDCHSDIFKQWKTSMHNLAHDDPVYVGVSRYLLKGLTDPEETAEAESCVKCHTPVGYVTGYPLKTSDERKTVPPIAAKGIQCDYCHSAVRADKPYNNGLVLSPGHGENDPGIKRGPLKDAVSDFHGTLYSEFHTGSEICGTCHNVSHVSFGTKLETTYDEWLKGPYNTPDEKTRVTCQGCHMFQRPGVPATGSTKRPSNKGVTADGSVTRDHVFTHYFVGGNTSVPASFGSPEKRDMALERLTHSATLTLDTGALKKGKLKIVVTNTGAGHNLPTGLTDVRQMWLQIRITDGRNRTVFVSGVPDAKGNLPEGTLLYNTVFGDGKGNPVSNISKAREILRDKRIPPKASSVEMVSFKTGGARTLSVDVKLMYRSAPQALMDQVFGPGKQILPVVTMVSAKKTVKL